jgi:hypothetical protein
MSHAYNTLFALNSDAVTSKVVIASQALKCWAAVARDFPGPDWRRNAAYWQAIKLVGRAFPGQNARSIVERRARWY